MLRTATSALPSVSRHDVTPPNPPLAQSLLEAHRFGPPPFLVRTLRYVAEDRNAAQGRLWDLNWSGADYRAAKGPRHLTLTLHAARCIVSEEHARRLFSNRSLPRSAPRLAFLHINLVAHQADDVKFCFAARHAKIRIWSDTPENDISIATLDDLPFSVHFDLSSYFALLSAPLAQLSVIVRISCLEAPPAPVHETHSTRVPSLTGRLVLWKDGKSTFGTAISNQLAKVPLQFTRSRYPFTDDDLLTTRTVSHGETPQNFESSIQLTVDGRVHYPITDTARTEHPKIFVTVRYGSAQFPKWGGVVRHDFVCPWCQRNCYRFRTLLSHFQVDHADFRFSLQGLDSHAGEPDSNNNLPFTVQLEVNPIDPESSNSQATANAEGVPSSATQTDVQSIDDDDDGEIYVNPRRFRVYVDEAKRAREKENAAVEAAMKNVNLGADSHDSDSTIFDQERAEDLLSIVRDDLWNFCSHCGRRHDCSYNDKDEFCSEWCEISHKKDKDDENDDRPLLANASVPRERKVDYKETLGKLELYHIVSVAKMTEDHYDENDPDSEEEVDQSWRLDLNIERVRSLEGVSSKEKILWILWNRFAHASYPIPSLYGERYTRYSLELFVLENKAEIEQLKLRSQLFGLLKALHVHGLIDSKATLSIMQCLNGTKKRRDIGISVRPEMPPDRQGLISGNGGGTKGRRFRRTNKN